MDKIFIVKENYQASDGDDYYQWQDDKPISHHKSMKGALEKITKLVREKYDEFMKESNKMKDSTRRQIEIDIMNNEIEIEWTRNKMTKFPLYFVEKEPLEE